MSDILLKPCTYCDAVPNSESHETFWFNGHGPPPCYAVRCDNCGAQGPCGYGSERDDNVGARKEAAARWNAMRATEWISNAVAIDPDGKLARRELAEKILIKLIEVAPYAHDERPISGDGVRLAWDIADLFLRAENKA